MHKLTYFGLIAYNWFSTVTEEWLERAVLQNAWIPEPANDRASQLVVEEYDLMSIQSLYEDMSIFEGDRRVFYIPPGLAQTNLLG